ncbi:hypothetical protein [Aureimonas glaciei]|uniref:Uncharacterized protein n=1 Tax=Aureimonas glaciei TaxID=1776957 RepID=A0A916YE18_9HYPH|nr:hypothetical protein [Aureimonas glaciei]GGD41777.1 hypothetical protein GCM10011335_50580 [Aureimonas glaciei]
MRREYASPYISDLPMAKIGVECDRCWMRRRYVKAALLARIGDQNLPDLLPKFARAEGCTFTANVFTDRCRLRYDDESRIPKPPPKDPP